MLILGVNSWERDMPKELLIKFALKFADDVKAQGIAELQNFWLAHDRKLLARAALGIPRRRRAY